MKPDIFFTTCHTLLKTKIFRCRMPLVLSWTLTYRCTQRCLYCGSWEIKRSELDTANITGMLDQFYVLGARWVSFTGGEPLIRDDFGKIVRYAKKKGMYIRVSTNGHLVAMKISELNYVDRVKLSLDGPPSVNDFIRGNNSFRKAMEAIELCKKNNIKICIESVISKHNLENIPYIIELAKGQKLEVSFQPATENMLFFDAPNPVAASIEEYKKAFSFLILAKKKGAPIANSLVGLQYFYRWSPSKTMYCHAGLLYFTVQPDGEILACPRTQGNDTYAIDNTLPVKDRINTVPIIKKCNKYCCASLVELNLISSFHPRAIFNYTSMV